MNKTQALNLLKLLSALESWAFANKTKLPDYLHDALCKHIEDLEEIVLGETK